MAEKFQDQLKRIRAELSLSQSQVASALKVSRAAVGQWERGETTPSFQNLQQFNSMVDHARSQRDKLNVKFGEADKLSDFESALSRDLIGVEFLLSGKVDGVSFQSGTNIPVTGVAVGNLGQIVHVHQRFKGENPRRNAFFYMPRPSALTGDDKAYGISILTTALEPRYEKGDILYCSRAQPIEDGDYLVSWEVDNELSTFGRLFKVQAQIEDLLKVRNPVDGRVNTLRRDASRTILDRVVPWSELIAAG